MNIVDYRNDPPWWESDPDLDPEARARYAEQAARERQEREERERLQRFAREQGYGSPAVFDLMSPEVCPTCGAMVLLSGVERHTAWHQEPRP